jgi:hypothetical protein
MSEGKNKTLNMNKNFHLLDACTDFKKFITKIKTILNTFLVRSLLILKMPYLMV